MKDPLLMFVVVLVLIALLAHLAKLKAREAGIPAALSRLAIGLAAG